ncbi:amino acid ABC transporter permease [Lichenibacterium dinghuense]|uniref:amino acid ABC transporter permease n=1 Tax=Lichenibacterium dinghuense TaxID=2895977 RepID=UPI001F4604DF|nr:amino acid ABC transporter permease [Lichenibacterium sp. 6Y81]
MSFDPSFVLAQLPDVLAAAGVTAAIWAAGAVLGVALGFAVAAARRFGPRPVGLLLRLCVELLRGSPFLVQLFLLYYGGPYLGLSLDPVPAGLLALSVYGAAYYSEIFRGGFAAVPPGHVEAAACLGFTRAQALFRVELPEMAVLVMPALVNMTILLLKETAVLSIITVPELTLAVSAIGSATYRFVEALFLLALLYWGLVEGCGALGRLAEARLSRYRAAAA